MCPCVMSKVSTPAGQIVKTTSAQNYNRFDSEDSKRDI